VTLHRVMQFTTTMHLRLGEHSGARRASSRSFSLPHFLQTEPLHTDASS
jgi:hypothetical protein